MLAWNESEPSCKMAAGSEIRWFSHRGNQRGGCDDTNAGNGHQSLACLASSHHRYKVSAYPKELRFNLAELLDKIAQSMAGYGRKLIAFPVFNELSQNSNVMSPSRANNAEFCEVSADCINQLCSLVNQHLSDPVQDQNFLLHLFFDRNEPHGRPSDRFAYRLRISRIASC
jgi:hypothetical protein